MNIRFENKVALVTGAGSRLGLATAKAFAESAMVRETIVSFGRLDAAYNNAGVQNVLAETADTTREDYDRVMGINLRGIWSSMKFELQHMRKQGSGAIINCASRGAFASMRSVRASFELPSPIR
jgi:NAD(P)-dependent dehydrogenase (short-subunit alcohol dehydrogenase family)